MIIRGRDVLLFDTPPVILFESDVFSAVGGRFVIIISWKPRENVFINSLYAPRIMRAIRIKDLRAFPHIVIVIETPRVLVFFYPYE